MKRFIVYYFLFLFSFLSLFVSGIIDSQDGFQYLAVAREIYYKHEPTAPPYEFTGGVWVGKNTHMSTQVGKDGKTYSQTGIGYSLAMIPAVALSDLVYKIYKVPPPVHFPLESDWFILFAASFTNVFYASLLGIILFLYFLKLKLSLKQALFLSFISIITTNLFVLAKHSYAHIMFTTFLLLSFYLIKEYSEKKKKIFLIFSALSFGITSTVYNQTFLLAILPLGIYYLLLIKPKNNLYSLKLVIKDSLLVLLILTPFTVFYFWLENLRAAIGSANYANPRFFVDYAQYLSQPSQLPLIFEGIYGQLLGSGRSIFIYSPALLLILIFWHKIKKDVRPELIIFLLLSVSFIILYAKQISFEPDIKKYIGYWAGELSWGPRYLLPLIPFGMLLVGHIFQQLKTKVKVFVVYPLLVIGLYVEILGVTIPYQTKLHGLDTDIYVSGLHYTSFLYMNLLPQFSPIFSTTKKLNYLIHSFPKTLDHGPYNVRFYDGIDFPFDVGSERWRSIETKGHIAFDNNPKETVKKISLTLINHPLADSTSSAQVKLYLSQKGEPVASSRLILGKRSDIDITIPSTLLKEKDNQLVIETYFEEPGVQKQHKQLVALLSFYINGHLSNLESLDFPYISTLGPAMERVKYQTYGGILDNPWQSWIIHTQIFERVPDFWWIKPLYYWDVPKNFFIVAFLINVLVVLFSAAKIVGFFRSHKTKKL